MKRVIAALYHGRLHPSERDYSKSGEFALLDESFQQDEAWLMEQLNDKEKELLADLVQVHRAMNRFVSYESFHDGFVLGVNLVMEACCGAAEIEDE